MPTYTLQCQKKACKALIEEFKSATADFETKACPKCKGKVKQVLDLPTFHLKGAGWPGASIKKFT